MSNEPPSWFCPFARLPRPPDTADPNPGDLWPPSYGCITIASRRGAGLGRKAGETQCGHFVSNSVWGMAFGEEEF